MNFKCLNSTSEVCSLTIKNYNADTVSLEYSGLNGNQPCSYGNFVAIWAARVIPWTVQPLARKQIPQNDQMGSYVMSGDFTITDNAYVVGYAVGDKITDICAVAYISPVSGKLADPPDRVYMSINKIGRTFLSVNYYTLSGYLPKTYKNWLGIWEGYASPYNAPRPVGKSSVDSDSNQGTIEIDNIELSVDRTYTLVYFMGANRGLCWPRTLTDAAAILYFQTATG